MPPEENGEEVAAAVLPFWPLSPTLPSDVQRVHPSASNLVYRVATLVLADSGHSGERRRETAKQTKQFERQQQQLCVEFGFSQCF